MARAVVAAALPLALMACAAGPRLTPAAPVEAGRVLTADDEYLRALTPADLSIRLSQAEGGTLEVLRQHYAAGTLAWTAEETARLAAMARRHKASLDALRRWLPGRILLIKATPAIEGGLPHTRGTAISFGPALPKDDAALDTLFFHELFHVLSRHNAGKRDALYALIGFAPCAALEVPADLVDARITNPDAVETRHVVPVAGVTGADWLLPYLQARPSRFDPATGSRLSAYFNLIFAGVTRSAEGNCSVNLVQGKPQQFDFPAVRQALFANTGANTSYVIHPEETLADNFADLITGKRAVPNPEVQDRIATFLGIRLPPRRP